ncbi:MAG TPA: hypothetical protein PK228_00765 [Saprospiraceae bacterium]|nr:hypothetical protein [Saprospiraceae bacterium]
MKKVILLIICTLSVAFASGQVRPAPPNDEAGNKGKAILLHLLFGFHLPAGDMADRFGPDASFGLATEYLTTKNFILGAEGQYFFGSKVNEDPLAILRTPEGDIIGKDRLLASVALRKRGYYFGGLVGKLFTFNEKRAGIRLTFGAGYMRHWIRIQDDNSSVTQLTGDYKKGYDRLTGGLALNQFIGWQNLAPDGRSNWLIGLEFNEGFTNTLRDWDFNDMRKLDDSRLDLRIGLRVAWTLPFYQGPPEEIFY